MPSPKPLIPPPWKVEILASDINYTVLRTAQEAVYSETQMEAVDYPFRLRYFDKVGDRYALKKSLKKMVYFDEAEQKRLVQKFYRCLNQEGYLFISHAESLFGLSDKYKMIHLNNGTAYQRLEATI